MASSKGQNPGLNSHNPAYSKLAQDPSSKPESSQASCPAALRWRGPLAPHFAGESRCTVSPAAQVHSAAFQPGSWATDLKDLESNVQIIALSMAFSYEARSSWVPDTPGGLPWPRRVKMSYKPSAAENVETKPDTNPHWFSSGQSRQMLPPSASLASAESRHQSTWQH